MELTTIENKTMTLITAISDAYRNEEKRGLYTLPALKFGVELNADFTAMLLAMKLIFENLTGSDADLIDFTHMLNKLAVQYLMEGREEK